jgi:hypothetical protein
MPVDEGFDDVDDLDDEEDDDDFDDDDDLDDDEDDGVLFCAAYRRGVGRDRRTWPQAIKGTGSRPQIFSGNFSDSGRLIR